MLYLLMKDAILRLNGYIPELLKKSKLLTFFLCVAPGLLCAALCKSNLRTYTESTEL